MKMKMLCAYLFVLLLLSSPVYCQDTIVLKDYVSNLKKMNVKIAGRSYFFLFDTGGGETMISPDVASDLKKNIRGRVTGYRMSGESVTYPVCDSVTISLNHTDIFHSTVGVWDLMKILPKNLPRLDGIISLHSFKDKQITIDLKNNWIIIENALSVKRQISNKKLLQSRFANGLAGTELNIFLPVLRKGIVYWLLFDSGNIGNLLLSHNAAYEWRLEKDSTNENKEFGEISVTIGNKKLKTSAESASIIYDGALNYDLISKSVYTIDFVHKKIWMG
jgi:hypothetical protein